MILSIKTKIVFMLGLLVIGSSIFFFGDGFITNLLWQGCYEDGFPGNYCAKSDEATYKAYKAIFLFFVGLTLVMYSVLSHLKIRPSRLFLGIALCIVIGYLISIVMSFMF